MKCSSARGLFALGARRGQGVARFVSPSELAEKTPQVQARARVTSGTRRVVLLERADLISWDTYTFVVHPTSVGASREFALFTRDLVQALDGGAPPGRFRSVDDEPLFVACRCVASPARHGVVFGGSREALRSPLDVAQVEASLVVAFLTDDRIEPKRVEVFALELEVEVGQVRASDGVVQGARELVVASRLFVVRRLRSLREDEASCVARGRVMAPTRHLVPFEALVLSGRREHPPQVPARGRVPFLARALGERLGSV